MGPVNPEKTLKGGTAWMTHGWQVKVLLQELPVYLDSEEYR